MPVENQLSPGFGLYFHVPYCRALCHYCDFAKTANFGSQHLQSYAQCLVKHTDQWSAHLASLSPGFSWSSVFFGGGTPSLMSKEYAPLFANFKTRLRSDAEVSLEANPDDITDERLSIWRDLGVNRLSLGVQTFSDEGLSFLKRLHSKTGAERAIASALAAIPNVNVDLIYGWPGQTVDGFRADIDRALKLGVTHLSLYNLTYEPRTPIGRAQLRGMIIAPPDELLEDFYIAACRDLSAAGFEHEEVSNWHKPGYACRHNHTYWQDGFYVGIGAGAHGYLPSPHSTIGWRYAYPRSDRMFLRPVDTGGDPVAMFGLEADADRTPETWLMEYVGSGLRCAQGIDIRHIEAILGRNFTPRPPVIEGLSRGLLQRRQDAAGDRLYLQTAEWFRETAWSLEVVLSF